MEVSMISWNLWVESQAKISPWSRDALEKLVSVVSLVTGGSPFIPLAWAWNVGGFQGHRDDELQG